MAAGKQERSGPKDLLFRVDLVSGAMVAVGSGGDARESRTPRQVKLFRDGRNQAVRIPREFELPGREAIMRNYGDRLILEPTQPKSLLAVLATLEPLDEEFPPIPELDLDGRRALMRYLNGGRLRAAPTRIRAGGRGAWC